MDTQKLFYRVIYVLFIVGIIAFIISECVLPVETSMDGLNANTYPEKWFYRDETGSKVYFENKGYKVSNPRGKPFTVESIIPQNIKEGECICIRSSQQNIDFYIDGNLRYRYDSKDSRIGGKNSQSGYIFCPLKKEDAGKSVQIQTISYTHFSGLTNQIYLGSENEIWGKLMRTYFLETVISGIMFFLGLISVIGGVVVQKRYKKRQIIEASGWVVMLGSLIALSESQVRQMFFPNFTAIAESTYYNLPILMMAILLFVDVLQEKRYHKAYFFAFCALFVCLVMEFTLYALNVIELFNYIWVMLGVCMVALFIILASTIVDIINHEAKRYAGMIWSMIIFLLFALIGNILVNYSRVLKSLGIFLSSGLFFTLFESLKITYNDIIEIENRQTKAISQKEAREKFFISISHEIRTPLNGVLGLNDYILKNSTEPKIVEYAKKIEKSGELLHMVISDLLDFSKAEAKKLNLVYAPYDTIKLFGSTFDMFETSATLHGLKVKYEISESLPSKMEGDEYRIKQVLINLLSNAVKYTEQGSITVSADFEEIDEANVLFKISVKDTGQGIREENIDKLFDTFERLEEEKNKAIQGTGLGLAISKKLIDLMQGEIKVTSVFGNGSCFTIKVPQKIIDRTEIGNFEKKRGELNSTKSDNEVIIVKNKTALAVDDNEINLVVIESLLSQGGIKVEKASSGVEAIELCKKQKFDMIFMDHIMPGMNGIETMQEIKSQEASLNKNTMIIALTANEHPGIKQEYIDKGFADYLSKPIKIPDLNQILSRFV